jgi:hypothetical protein
MITKIISGGQTGADQGALAAAQQLGIPTGGTATKGYQTETGPNKDLHRTYSLTAATEIGYRPRTISNVISSDGTLMIGKITSIGSRLTNSLCLLHSKPVMYIYWTNGTIITPLMVKDFRDWLTHYRIRVLNVAGNRESINPGIFNATRDFLIEALRGEEADLRGISFRF